MPISVEESELRLKAQQAITEMNKLTTATQGFAAQLADVLKYLDDINKKSLSNINKQINNVTQNRNIGTQNIGNNYDMGSAKHVAKNSNGSVMTSDSGRDKLFREYEQAIIDETNAIKKDVEERTRLRKQRADAEDTRNKNTAAAIAKREDKTSQSYLEDRRTRAQAELLRAKAQQAGALLNNPRYQFGKAFQAVGGKLGTIGVGSDKIEGRAIGGAISAFGALLKSPIAGGTAALTSFANGIVDVGKAATQAYAEIESIKTQLGVVFSNQTQADSMFGEISQYSVKSPFGVQQTSELAVLLKQSGVYASDLMDTLRMIGDTAGGNMEKMKRIANNYAQIVSIGKASMLDMRQFAYAGIPIFEAVSKELGVSQQELRKLISDGKVTSDIIEKVFKDLTGINGIFENATEKGAKTLKARLQNLQDAKQLAMANVGEYIYSAGTYTGNDSVVNNIVSGMENIYQWLQDKVNTVNIEKSVEAIEKRELRIAELSDLQEKYKDDPRISKLLDLAMASEVSKRNVENDRNIYNKSYENKINRANSVVDFKERFGEFDLTDKDVQNIASLLKVGRLGYQGLKGADFDVLGIARRRAESYELSAGKLGYSVDELLDLNLTKEELNDFISALSDATAALNGKFVPTINDIKAHTESELLKKQQSAYDLMNSQSDKSGSLLSQFREISSAYRDTDKYKEQEEKKREETLTQALEALKDIRKNTDENGRVDITKFSATQLSDYIKQGAFSASEKLNVVTGNSEVDKQNREDLMKQYGHIADLTGNFMKVALNDSRYSEKTAQFDSNVLKDLTKLSDTEFYNEFPKTYQKQAQALDDLINSLSDSDGRKQMLQMYRSLLDYSLNRIETDVTGSDASASDLGKASKQEFIPLWKRILAQYTGLTTTEMTSTADTMKKYSEDMAIRNMTSNVMSAAMKSMGVDTAMRLVSAGGAKQLKEDSAGTLQVNWKQTQENIKKFSLALSASTDVVSAYKKSLEDELEVYQQLIVAGYTQGENQNGGESQFISVKKLAQYAQSNEQLVNAFGDTLETANGKKYNVDELRFTQEGIFDKFGNKIDDQVKVTSNLSRFIENILPKLYDDIHKASVTELNSKVLEEAYARIAAAQQGKNFVSNLGASRETQYLLAHPEEMQNRLIEALTNDQESKRRKSYNTQSTVETNLVTKSLADMSPADILLAYARATDENINKRNEYSKTISNQANRADYNAETQQLKLIKQYVDEILKQVENELGIVLESPDHQDIEGYFATITRDEAVNNAMIELNAFAENLKNANKALTWDGQVITSETQLKPEDYTGDRGGRNNVLKYGWGLEQSYDIEDLYLRAAKTSKQKKEDEVNMWGIDPDAKDAEGNFKFKNDNGTFKSDEDILKNLNEQEKAWIRILNSQKDSAKVLNQMTNDMTAALTEFGKGAWEKPFEKMGENLVLGKDATEGMEDVYKNLAAELLEASGQAMIKAGWELVARGAAKDNMGMIAGGLGLVAAGGVSVGFGSGLSNSDKDKDKTDKQTDRLEQLRDDLQKLLEQARTDALYYENNLRHKSALGTNAQFSYKSVHDAVITPRGDVVTTDPKDYLIATKTPQQLAGGNTSVSVTPVINNIVNNNTNARVTQEQRQNADGSIDIITMIDDAVGNYIASSKSDSAFAAREARVRARQAVM